MNIYFDARWTKIGRHDGISRYGSSLVGALAKIHPVTMIICDRRQLAMLPEGIPYIMANKPLTPRELWLPFRLNRLGADVVYSPMQLMGTFGRKYKLIFTLHDLIFYKYKFPPTYISPPARLAWWAYHHAYWPGRWLLNSADFVVTVSETSKQEIIEHHLTDREVGVVYNAPSALPVVVAAAEPKRELVFMGTLMPYKNAELLIRALELLPEYRLHLVGRGTPDRLDALRRVAGANLDRITFWNGASDQDYAQVLNTATASVSASRAEGFGLPVIEAMAVGVPFACTDMPIFHEVGGEAALYFDPDSPADFAAKIRSLEDPATRARVIAAGYVQAAKFTWDDSAARLLAIMTKLTAK